MKPFNTQAHINSLNGEMKEITVLGPHTMQSTYIVKFGDIKCTAVFNPFTNQFYADDKYGIIGYAYEKV